MIDYDICLCGSKECDRRGICLRAIKYDSSNDGIYTVSLLAPVCNETNNYKEFIAYSNYSGTTCGSCNLTDGLVYTSNPPMVKCSVTGEYKYFDDTCHTSDKNESKEEVMENSEKLVKKHKSICNHLNSVYEAKNSDYGNSFGDTFKRLGIISAITRISDKYNRLVSLGTGKEQKVKDESLKDTLLDLANYCIMTVMELECDDYE